MPISSNFACDAPTLNQRLQRRHLSPVKDIEIFLRDTPKCFSLQRFIVRNTSCPTVDSIILTVVFSGCEDFRLLGKMVNLPSNTQTRLSSRTSNIMVWEFPRPLAKYSDLLFL